jgi:hypothetical protein
MQQHHVRVLGARLVEDPSDYRIDRNVVDNGASAFLEAIVIEEFANPGQ